MTKKSSQIFLSTLIILIGSTCVYAQVLTDTTLNQVIRVEGTVYSLGDSLPLTTGSIIRPRASLLFDSPSSRIILITSQNKLVEAFPDQSGTRLNMMPILSKYSTRNGTILSYISFVKFLEGRDWLVLGDSVRLEVGREEFIMDEDHFFFIRYQIKGDSLPINKKLSHQDQQVLFSKQEIFQVDGQPIASDSTGKHQLFYYDAVSPASTLINTIRLIFPDEKLLKKEVEAIIRYLGIAYPNEEKVQVIENYLFEVYGIPVKENLGEWLQLHFKL